MTSPDSAVESTVPRPTPWRGRQHVLVVPDGAADRYRLHGRSPLALAATPYCDRVARRGISGRLLTLHPELPRGSLVAHLDLLGWDPRVFYPHGRSSCELLAVDPEIPMAADDLALRANLVRMEDRVLASYNADFIRGRAARRLAERITREISPRFSDLELVHNGDFRNTLIVRGAGIDPRKLVCPEPHEHQGEAFDPERLIGGRDAPSRAVAARLNAYLSAVAKALAGARANLLFPWSPSSRFHLTPFRRQTGYPGRAAVVGFMDFLHGIARAGGLDACRIGDGGPDTDYRGKGRKVVELLTAGYGFVLCHVNAPDEAAHMADLDAKVHALERVDRHVVAPIVRYFHRRPERLGGVLIVPDHYTNLPVAGWTSARRAMAHSLDPVPFALWNGRDCDATQAFSEDDALGGRHGRSPLGHGQALPLLGVAAPAAARAAAAGAPSP